MTQPPPPVRAIRDPMPQLNHPLADPAPPLWDRRRLGFTLDAEWLLDFEMRLLPMGEVREPIPNRSLTDPYQPPVLPVHVPLLLASRRFAKAPAPARYPLPLPPCPMINPAPPMPIPLQLGYALPIPLQLGCALPLVRGVEAGVQVLRSEPGRFW